ncbi:MAG: HAD-IC family P-type ATPase [Gammaproteobacteria bacterium]|jgi:Ca2+-transporting ATPase
MARTVPTSAARWRIELLHDAAPGRARLRIPALRGCNGLAATLAEEIAACPGVEAARVTPASGTLVLRWPADQPTDAVLGAVSKAVAGVAGLPPASVAPEPPAGAPPARATARPTVARPGAEATGDRPAAPDAVAWHALEAGACCRRLGTSARGLAAAEARRRLAESDNSLPEPAEASSLAMLARQVNTPPVYLLGGAAAISVATGGLVDALAIAVVVAANTVTGFLTERASERTIRSLALGAPLTARVRRGRRTVEIPLVEVVPGDLLVLGPGDYVAADARLLEADRLYLDEAALTGESLPCLKAARTTLAADTPLAGQRNRVFRGTVVTGGSGLAVVCDTGLATELGRIQSATEEASAPTTPLERQLERLSYQLTLISGAACAGVFGVGALRRLPALELVRSTISLGVAAVPEGLPAVATSTLAMGIRRMGRQRTSIRQMNAVETLGAIQVLCLDKTGTLTQNRMRVAAVSAGGAAAGPMLGRPVGELPAGALKRLLETVALCSEAESADGAGWTGSPTEVAMMELAEAEGADPRRLRASRPRRSLNHRSDEQRYMIAVHGRGRGRAYMKGSPPEVLALCTHELRDGRRLKLGARRREAIRAENDDWAGQALRVLGVADGPAPVDGRAPEGLTWLGLVGLEDPLRPGTERLVRELQDAGIRPVMITGDQAATAEAVARRLGLARDRPLRVLEAARIAEMDPQALEGLARSTDVFARVTPADKLRIVTALQRSGRVVAMTGDGLNDGPALKASDVGIAMGEAGQDVARRVADVVVEDNRLETLIDAVAQGRTTYGNIRKSIHYLLSTNLSEIGLMLSALALGLESPLSPLQLLWINLATDVAPAIALGLDPPEPDVMAQPPRDPDAPMIGRSDLWRITREGVVITAGALAAYLAARLFHGPGARAGSVAFTTLTSAQLLHALNCRAEHAGFSGLSRLQPNRLLSLSVGGALGLQAAALVVPPARRLLGTMLPLPVDLALIAAGSLVPLVLNDRLKAAATPPAEVSR